MHKGNKQHIENVFIYKIDVNYLNKTGELLCKTIDNWNKENGCECYSSIFAIEEVVGELIIDYSFDVNNGEKIKKLTEQILNRFNVEYIVV